MRWHEITNEAPIGDYSVHGTNVGGPRLRQMKKPKVSKVIHKAFANVNYDINVYVLPTKMISPSSIDGLGISSILSTEKQRAQAQNPGSYVQIDLNKLKKILPPRIANKIKVDSNGTTVIFLVTEGDVAFDISPWSVIHDLIHGFTLTTKKISQLFYSIDKIFRETIKKMPKNIKNNFSYIHSGETLLMKVLTMKSATSGELDVRPEEGSTELFTQWLFSGKITLTADRLAKEYNLDQKTTKEIQKILNQSIPKVIRLFKEILKEAKGLVLITGN